MHDLFYSSKTTRRSFFNPLSFQTSGTPPQVSKHLFTANPPFAKERYGDLDLFRERMTESKAGFHHQPYTNNKKNTLFYKTIFLGFSALFFILGVTTMATPSALGCGFFFSSCSFLKGMIVTICTSLSLASLTVGLRLKPEKEAIIYCVRKTKAQAAAIYARKQIRMGIKSMFAFIGENRHKAIALKQMYEEVCDKIHDKKEETAHLVHRIATAETLDPQEKEALLNQAIEELNDKLQYLTHTFRHATLPLVDE